MLTTQGVRRIRSVFLAAFLCCSGAGVVEAADPPLLDVRVDPRIELMSIVFRLAGHPEYNKAEVPAYAEAVDAHFGAHADHEVVRLARRLRTEQGIGYDAVMSMAVHLADARAPAARVGFDPLPVSLESRWTTASAREFVAALSRFVADTDFAGFLDRHADYHRETERRMAAVLADQAVVAWCEEYFGAAPGARFVVDLGLLNGPGSYGVHFSQPGAPDELHCVLGVWQVGPGGLPVFHDSLLGTVVHEFVHSFTNPLVDAHEDSFARFGPEMYEPVADRMEKQAYGTWRSMIYETLVRGATIRWILANRGEAAALYQAESDESRGFLWMKEYVALLAEYEADRDAYPDYASFMPRILAFCEKTAPEVEGMSVAEEVGKAAPGRR